mgnify:CR=1 FL=1
MSFYRCLQGATVISLALAPSVFIAQAYGQGWGFLAMLVTNIALVTAVSYIPEE